MRQTALTERTSPHAPTPGTARKTERQWRILIGIQTNLQPQIFAAPPEQLVHGLAEKIFAGAIHETQAAIGIECEHGDVDLRHDRSEQRCRFERSQALEPERLAQRVDFEECFAERVIGPGTPRADRIIAFPQRREQVGHRLQRAHDVFPRI
jgi:hypothetical protein